MTEPKKYRTRSLEGMTFRQGLDGGSYTLMAATPEQIAGGNREKLSISVAHQVDQCPAAQLAKNNMPRPVDPFAANELGTGAHDVLEHFYLLPPAQRTEEALARLTDDVADRVWSERKLVDLFPPSVEANRKLRQQWRDQVHEWALRILLMENPAEVEVIGTEIELDGVRTSNGILSTGKIDRLERRDEKLVIVDYKFGEWKGEPNPRFKDGYKEQQYLYLDLYEELSGETPQGMEILYPRAPHRRVIEPKEAERLATLESFQQARTELDTYVAAGAFPAKPGPLCAWCDIARSCPAAQIKRVTDFEPPAGQPLESMPSWKQDKRLKAIKANAEARKKPSSAHLGIRVIDREGNDIGVHDDSRFQQPEPTAFPAPPAPAPAPAALETLSPRIPQSEPTIPNEGFTIMTMQTSTPRAEAMPSQEMAGPVLNLNSWAAKNAADLATFGFWMLREYHQNLGPVELQAINSLLARITSNVTFMTTGLRSLQTGSASRSLVAVKTAVRAFPAPFGADHQAWAEWTQRIERVAIALVQSIDMVHAAATPQEHEFTTMLAAFPAVSTTPAVATV